jgi:cell division transport system permease protein
MQINYVVTELGQGLRRNLSMHIAVILTLFVSLTLVGLGFLLNAEAKKTEEYLGSEVQITVFLCNKNSTSPNCDRAVTEAQENAILSVVTKNPEVSGYHTESQQEAYDKAKELLGEELVRNTGPEAMRKTIWIQLKDPKEYDGIVSAVEGLDGVHGIQDNHEILGKIFSTIGALKWGAVGVAGFLVLAALLLVANTIRLAAFARRREIGIMRLVGASTLYIALPFLLEALVTAVFGVLLATGALAAFMWFAVHERLEGLIDFLPWIGFEEYVWSVGAIAILGPLLTVIPTLVLTRKYLKV